MACNCGSEDDISVFGSVYGTVTDADSGQPLQGATVVLTPTNVSSTTGADGAFEFQNLMSQQYNMTVTKSGYLYNSRQVTVTPGQNTVSDITLSPEKEITGFSLSTEILTFGSNYSELTFVITNNSSSSATSWSITDIDVDWLSVSPSTGTTAMGQQSVVKVTIDRDYITESKTTYFIVNAAGGSKQVMVTASKAESGGGSSSDTDDDLSINTTSLAFGEDYNTLTFTISNSGVSSFDFGIWLVNPGWLSFACNSTTVAAGGSQTVSVSVDRDLLYGSGEVTIEIRTDVGSKYITITAYEPISYGTVSSCDRDIEISVTGVETSGTTVYIDFKMINNGSDTHSQFRVGMPQSSGLMYAVDDLYNTYYYSTAYSYGTVITGDVLITVNGLSITSYSAFRYVQNSFMAGTSMTGEITVKNVDSSATKFTLINVGTYAYGSTNQLDETSFKLYNVPIIR